LLREGGGGKGKKKGGKKGKKGGRGKEPSRSPILSSSLFLKKGAATMHATGPLGKKGEEKKERDPLLASAPSRRTFLAGCRPRRRKGGKRR